MATTTRTARSRIRSWLEYQHKEYVANVTRWKFARDHYTGEVVDAANVTSYLVKRAQGESDKAYKERCDLADYSNYFASIIDGFVGMLANVEANANRPWNDEENPGLGDIADRTTPAGRLWHRADPDGNGWLTVWKNLATELAITHLAWVLVDSVGTAREPVIRILPAACVTNWRYGADGILEEVLVEEEVDQRTSLQQEPACARQFIHFTLQGWQRYRLTDKGELETLTGPGNVGTYRYVSPDRNPALPIFPVRLPMARQVGWLIAVKCNRIFNQESARDHLLRAANFPKLRIHGTKESFDQIVEGLNAGYNVLHNPPGSDGAHDYIAPSSEPAKIATEVIEKKVIALHITASREYGDAARERTATEVRQDVSAGAGAYLGLKKAALDDAENNALWRIEQLLYPDDAKHWYVSSVERSDDFLPADPDAVMLKLAERTWGAQKPVPMGITAKISAAEEIATYSGLEFDADELRAAVLAEDLMAAMNTAIDAPWPSEVKVQVVMAVLTANGLLDAKRFANEQEKTDFITAVKAKVEELAEAAELAKRREAEAFPGFGSRTPPDEQ